MSNTTTSRGGWWVVGQFVILALILIVGYFDPWRTTELFHIIVGVITGGGAILFLVLAFSHLGRNLTPFPKPLADGALVTHGVYAFVRHPIYVAVICASLAYSIFMGSWLAGIGCAVLAVWFDRKAAREEAFLHAKFADYTVYSNKVAKFIPRLY